MNFLDRRKEILKRINKEGSVQISDLARYYQVGLPTIRRDLKYLSENYGIEIAYGGAYRKEGFQNQNAPEVDLLLKYHEHLEEKRLIAKKAASLIKDGDTIALNAGSTVELVLDYLEPGMKINIVTLALNVAMRAMTIPDVSIYMPGGKVRKISQAFFGSESEAFLQRLNIDKAFLGVTAVSLENGVTHVSMEEIRTNQIMAEISKENFLLADHSKFNKTSLMKMYDLRQFTGFIVDEKTPRIYLDYAKNNGILII